MPASPIFSIPDTLVFTGENDVFYNADHLAAMEIPRGTFALTFTANDVTGRSTLFSKDGAQYDNGGHITAWIDDGALKIRQQTEDESEWLSTHEMTIAEGQSYHLAITFGAGGLKIYLDGLLILAEPEMREGLDTNTRELLIGASGAWREDDGQFPAEPFNGEISNFQLYDKQLQATELVELATEALGADAVSATTAAMAVEELIPAFTQLHHGSDAARELAMEYGLMGHGGMGGMDGDHDMSLNGVLAKINALVEGDNGDNTLDGGSGDDLINGGLGDDTIKGGARNDILQGYYGNDVLEGGGGRDILDGGHGEDVLIGGDGDDLLITRADGREPDVYPDPDRDEGDPYDELTNGKLYPDQPIPADDILTGGAGADTFYVQTLINAKQRFIEEHTNDDGTIRWHGVAGENDNIHDHWVDGIARDIITDFSKEEGDRILIEGHTTEILEITYGDADGDGAADHSNVYIYSQQGNGGGAHDEDRLGVLTVYGDLVTETDIEADAGPAYGIVNDINGLREAIEPISVTDDPYAIVEPVVTQDDGPSAPFVYFLYDTETDEVLGQVQSGDMIDIDLISGRPITFAVAPVGFEVGSMRLRLGNHSKMENSAPFALFGGNSNNNFFGDADIGLGDTTIFVEAYAEDNGEGALLAFDNLSFSVVEDAPSMIVEVQGDTPNVEEADPYEEPVVDFPNYDRDDVLGTSTNDVINGTEGHERMLGGNGDDIVRGYAGSDELDGGVGADILRGGADNDMLDAGSGDDIASGDAGDDMIDGALGDDVLRGGAGNDIMNGGDGDDIMVGDRGDDAIYGEAGNDILKGGLGNDIIVGGAGDDKLMGGGGVDYFVFGPASGVDVVRDFTKGEDAIDLSAYGFSSINAVLMQASQAPNGVRIQLSDNDSVMIRNAQLSELEASDFVL